VVGDESLGASVTLAPYLLCVPDFSRPASETTDSDLQIIFVLIGVARYTTHQSIFHEYLPFPGLYMGCTA
jgi:hypothetical protein